jgi:phosphoglycerate dehydrogenase-like enzyme
MSMKILIGADISQEKMLRLRAAAPEAEVVAVEERDAVLTQISDADAYIPGPWDEGVLPAAGRLRWVHFRWAGVGGQLFPALIANPVVVTNSAGVFAIPMAEHAMALMLALARALNVCLPPSPEDPWRATAERARARMRELHGATLGILGYGGIGRATAERARGFGMRVLALRRHPEPDEFADAVWGPERLDDLLRQTDYLLVSCALTDETRGMVGERELALMKPHAVIVNVARGAVIAAPALLRALQEHRIGGAALDVTDPEPLPADSPLWHMDNVIITPHVSGSSPETSRRQFELLEENVRRFAAGRDLLNVVDKQAGY